MDLERVKRAFRRNRFECSVFETKEEAAEYLDHAIDGVTVGFGDSETLSAMGISDRLALHNKVWDVQKSDHFKHGDNSFLSLARKALTADVFLTSVNGASETGVLVNLDGTGNRVSGSIFGHRKVYFVFGVNKLAPTLEEAISRARNVAAPKNVERHHFLCGCSAHGYDRCYDCGAPDRICNVMVIYYKKMRFMDMEVVIINEDLGL
ncbi:lactate utilization protein [uncultured Dialister sp.]|uniref:lactate utilization protein n=1 Tax=uncultured Dialister sp. TaxID=278064 RepID=UPI0025D71901|nr:lactate utilization protein [uncultured Dialister sp.]